MDDLEVAFDGDDDEIETRQVWRPKFRSRFSVSIEFCLGLSLETEHFSSVQGCPWVGSTHRLVWVELGRDFWDF